MTPTEFVRQALIYAVTGSSNPELTFQTVLDGLFIQVSETGWLVVPADGIEARDARDATIATLDPDPTIPLVFDPQ